MLCHEVDLDDQLNDAVESLTQKVDSFQAQGSGWRVVNVHNLKISYVACDPLAASSYIATPKDILNKKAVLNIKNMRDDFCFLYCISAHIHPVDLKDKVNDPKKYRAYFQELNYEGLNFPLAIHDIPKFE